MCICIYIYPSHFNCVGAQFLWSHLQTTSHVVLVRPEGNRCVKKMVQELKWSRSRSSMIMLESETCFSSSATMTPPQHVSLHFETSTTLRSFPETLQMTALPSSSLYLHMDGYNRYLLAYFQIFFCTRHTLCMRIH